MGKYWEFPNSKPNKIILIKNGIIYKGNPQEKNLDFLNNEELLKNLFEFPINKIEKIENVENSNYIKIYFNQNSKKYLYIENEKIKSEIIEYLKIEFPEFKYKKEIPTNIEFAKKLYLMKVVIFIFFCISLYFAIGLSNGEKFELKGMKVGLLHFFLFIAKFGITKLIIGYLIIFSFTLSLLIKKLRKKGIIETLKKKN